MVSSLFLFRLASGAKFKSKVAWAQMVEKIVKRLDSWKILKKGRLTLIKSSLASILNYFLSLFTIPAFVVNKIELSFKNFLWNEL